MYSVTSLALMLEKWPNVMKMQEPLNSIDAFITNHLSGIKIYIFCSTCVTKIIYPDNPFGPEEKEVNVSVRSPACLNAASPASNGVAHL